MADKPVAEQVREALANRDRTEAWVKNINIWSGSVPVPLPVAYDNEVWGWLRVLLADNTLYKADIARDIDAMTLASEKIRSLLAERDTLNALCDEQRDANVRVTAERDALTRAGVGYSQQTVDAITKARDALRQALTNTEGMTEYRAVEIDKLRQRLTDITTKHNALFDDATAEIRTLRQRVTELEAWKREASEVMDPVMAAGHKLSGLRLGESITEALIARAQRCEQAEAALKDMTVSRDFWRQGCETVEAENATLRERWAKLLVWLEMTADTHSLMVAAKMRSLAPEPPTTKATP